MMTNKWYFWDWYEFVYTPQASEEYEKIIIKKWLKLANDNGIHNPMYVISKDSGSINMTEVDEWVKENLDKKYIVRSAPASIYIFETDNELMAFKLRWV